jgi:hypothetical protein
MEKGNKYLTESEIISLSERILKEVLVEGRFGSLSKSDYELIIFDELTKAEFFKEKSNYALANEFKITESKVKNLTLSSGLRYRKNDRNRSIVKVLSKALREDKKPFDGNEVLIAIENPIDRREIEHALKSFGETPEYGRNREILKFSLNSFSILLKIYMIGSEKDFKVWCSQKYKDKEILKKIEEASKPLSVKIKHVTGKGILEATKIFVEVGSKYFLEKALS